MKKEIAIIFIIIGTFLFGMAFHDIDVSANLLNQGIALEQGTFGVLSNMDIYLNGMQEFKFAMLFNILGVSLLILNNRRLVNGGKIENN